MGVISRAVGTTTMAFVMVSTLGCGADEGGADTSTDTASDTAGDTAAETAMDTPDDTVDDTPDDTAEDPAMDAAGEAPDCLPPATASVSQGHSPGSNCLTCHAGWFTVAGTLYSTAEGVTAVGGATMVAVDATGTEVDMVTCPNGNFYTSQPVAYPLAVAASMCPDRLVMGPGATTGACNSCHGAGSRIHLP